MKKILLSLSLILLGYASFSQQDIKSRWIVNINGFRFTLHNAGDSIFKVKTDSVLFGKPTNLPFVSQSTLNDSLNILRDSLAAYRAQDTVYTESGIQTVYSGDSTKIRLPYKSYVAIIDIDGTAVDPTVTVLQNDLDLLPVWTRDAAGEFHCNATGMFTENKTIMPNIGLGTDLTSKSSGFHILGDDGTSISGIARFTNSGTDEIRLYTLSTSTGTIDDMPLRNFAVEIRVYF